MRKVFSIAACALALVCAGVTQAGNESATASSVASPVTSQLQQLGHVLLGTSAITPKAQNAFDAGSATSRSRTTATSSASVLQAEEQTGQAMMLAGLLVMGVIIKRRYGKRG